MKDRIGPNQISIAALVLVLACGMFITRAQKEEKPQQPCQQGTKIFVLDPDQVEDKLVELNAQGYCVAAGHLQVLGAKVLVIVDKNDLQSDSENAEQGN